ncbi:MAG: flavin reductase family protein [Burkholderiales bacterium]|jgi:flavin reductase (DIM6/NTAB) family NADH-FMN oxidoreductase RutF
MYYDTAKNDHGLPHSPFKAIVSPRPIGWISSRSSSGVVNLAPYSFFNAVNDAPPMVMFSSQGRKDSLKNIEDTGEFVCSLATQKLHQAMNLSSALVKSDVNEFVLSGLEAVDSIQVGPPRVAGTPAALECKLWKILELPSAAVDPDKRAYMVLGHVIGVFVDEQYVKDGMFCTADAGIIARMGYMDYCGVTAETTFTLNRPNVSEDGLTATVVPGPWDGVYR